MAKTLSGAGWVQKFPTSRSTNDLADPFKSKVNKFIAALKNAGANPVIAATRRPKERAYLMHFSFKISNGFDPRNVEEMPGVDIEWVHRDPNGSVNLTASKTAANNMVEGYGIAYEPALLSHHTQGNAIDMTIRWTSTQLTIVDAAGTVAVIKTGAKDGSNIQLHKVGATYGVIKLVIDPPHWSNDGH